jgi:uncharacterized protein YjeT (DUF2065 family)
LAPFAIPILALFIPIVAIIMAGLVRIKRNRMLHDTVRLMTEKGAPIPPELIDAVANDSKQQAKTWSPTAQLRSGVINIAIGLGFMFLLREIDGGPTWIWAAGMIPFMIGVGFLLIWWIESRKKDA